MPEANPKIIVQKYGGSSVADLEKIKLVAAQVVATRNAGFGVVVCVSAMGKRTNALLQMAAEASEGSAATQDGIPRREVDMLVSTGERVAMSLLCIAIQALGCEAISFTGSQCGIITNHRHCDARIIEIRPHRVEDELAAGRVVVVAGYQGVSYKREITTLGRGGTDTTAVALAAALGAVRCEIYSDVDGVYTADPRKVAEAKHLPEVAPEMVHELATLGAKVLHPQAIAWAKKHKIALYARKTGDGWHHSKPGLQTAIDPAGDIDPSQVAVCQEPPFLWVETRGASAHSAALIQDLTNQGIACRYTRWREDGAGFGLPLDNVPDRSLLLGTLGSNAELEVRACDEQCAVSVVCEGQRSNLFSEALTAITVAGLMLLRAHQSALAWTFFFPQDQGEAAQQALHGAFH